MFNISSLFGSKKLTGAVAAGPSVLGVLSLIPDDAPLVAKAIAGGTVGLAFIVQIAGQSIVDIIREKNRGEAELALGRTDRDRVLGKLEGTKQ